MTRTYLNPNGKGSSGILAPLEVIAQWPKPNYDDPVKRPQVVVPLVCILGTVMIATVGARMWARFVIQKNGKMDDWFMLLAMVRREMKQRLPILAPGSMIRTFITNMSTRTDSRHWTDNCRSPRYVTPSTLPLPHA